LTDAFLFARAFIPETTSTEIRLPISVDLNPTLEYLTYMENTTTLFAPKFIETDAMRSLVFEILDVEARFPEKPTPRSFGSCVYDGCNGFYDAHAKYLVDSIPFRKERVRLILEWQKLATLENPGWVKHFGLSSVGYW
jgi:hypothetical protein